MLDVVLNLKVIKHGDNLHQFGINCAARLKFGGIMIVETLNWFFRILVLAGLGAEYVLRWLPVGPHDWRQFLKPREIETMLACAGLVNEDPVGVPINSASQKWKITAYPSMYYIFVAEKRERPHPLRAYLS